MNTSDNDFDKIFIDLKSRSSHDDDKIYGTGLWNSWHDLADAHYQPAKEFFIEKLDSPRFDWRRESVRLLGFHYELENYVIEKIRDLLVHDPESGVRLACAGVLGRQSRLPDQTLVDALALDDDRHVREAAFFALLDLARLPYKTRLKELQNIESGAVTPSLEEVKRILTEEKLINNLHLLEG
jgi:ribulose bisphosphate carboxylase small subunit